MRDLAATDFEPPTPDRRLGLQLLHEEPPRPRRRRGMCLDSKGDIVTKSKDCFQISIQLT